nr:hypothetical protein [Clostridia bacterium]
EYFITVKANEAVDPAVLAGRMINIESGANTNAAYMIESAEAIGDGMIKLNIGDVTTVKGYVDRYDFSKGYEYHMAEGLAFRIPMSAETK